MHFPYQTSRITLPIGKLPMDLLKQLLKRYSVKDDRVVVGPEVGEDAAVVDIGGPNYLIAKTDPITFTAERIGWYAVHINANDIATMGGLPRWFLATLLLPEARTTPAEVEKIFQDIFDACQSLGISLIGGHTEVTAGLTRPVIIGQMLGEVEKERLVRTSGARVGDAIILTKGIAVEGTAIIARERTREVARLFGDEMLAKCRRFIYQPGISVLKEARIAVERARVHAMHDPTEGGLATALHEIGQAADVGIAIQADAVKVFPETRQLCDHYRIDPMGLIASGALLISVEPDQAHSLLAALEREGIPAAIIGNVTSKSQGFKILTSSGLQELPIYEQDELTKISGHPDLA